MEEHMSQLYYTDSPNILVEPSYSQMEIQTISSSTASEITYDSMMEEREVKYIDTTEQCMEITELYAKLLILYESKISAIRIFFKLHESLLPYIIMHNPSLIHYYFLTERQQYLYCRKLKQLNDDWLNIGYVKNKYTIKDFMNSETLRDAYGGSIVIIKYIDMYKNIIKKKYFVVNPENHIIQTMRDLPDRTKEPVDTMVRFSDFKWMYR